jgi:type III restriction enzyme
MPKAPIISQMHLADALKPEVEAWSMQGYPGVTQTTYHLLHYWFDRDEEAAEKLFECQKRAIEIIIYCHEILQVRSLRELFEKVAPEVLFSSKAVLDEVQGSPFSKYCLKMATGTGKTWVLLALTVWQYFNALNKEKPSKAPGETKDWYSYRFLVVAPGHEVLNRLLDAFKGRRDPKSGLRDPQRSDLNKSIFMPLEWRPKFHIEFYEPTDIGSNTTPPEGPFAFITNWQQFKLSGNEDSLWEKLTGEEVGEQTRGDFLAEFLSEFPDITVMNDEAHHVHLKVGSDEELVWRKFISLLYQRLCERHKKERGSFIQIDYSATPFFGTGTQKKFFPHIVYDYDLSQSMRDMLVKQLFLEERQVIAGERLEALDFRAKREKPEEGKKRGEIIGLSAGQKTLLEIGRKKLEQLSLEYEQKGIDKKPVMMILCEETEVADLVCKHFLSIADDSGVPYDTKRVMMIHTGLSEHDLEEARRRLDMIDDPNDPLDIVISVLMLREGFDRKNICAIVVLRATDADLLLEQIVGRGLRLMFAQGEYPQIWQTKIEAIEEIKRNKPPSASYDFLFIVEHPRFRNFYERLRQEGFIIGEGDTSKTKATADVIPVDAIPSRIDQFDIAFPVQVFEQGKFPDIMKIDVSKIPPYSYLIADFESLRESLGKLLIQETHVDTGKKTKSWKLENKYFNYEYFLSRAAKAVAEEGKTTILSGHLAEIAEVIDKYVSNRLFGKPIDFSDSKNYQVLNFSLIFDHVVDNIRNRILKMMGDIQYERTGNWRRLSDVSRLMLRSTYALDTWKCIYPKQAYSSVGGGFERDFMTEIIEPSADIMSFAKLDKRHALKIPYRDEHGILREYEVDFLIKTKATIYLVETKGDRDMEKATVAVKARAARRWCETASGVKPPIEQPEKWEYLLISEGLFKQNRHLSFGPFIPLCRGLRDRVIKSYENSMKS